MTDGAFTHVRAWVFDLDHTLYPPKAQLFDQIEDRIRHFMTREIAVDSPTAERLRIDYWRRYGTTLAGLLAHHDINPARYLDEVHDIDFTVLDPDPMLARAIAALPGRKVVYTNGARPYALKVLAARGLTGLFDAVYGIEHAGYRPKPEQAAFEAVFALDGLDPSKGAMFEDAARNLAVPHQMGMRTVLVGPDPLPDAHIHHHTPDLSDFLSQITAKGFSRTRPRPTSGS